MLDDMQELLKAMEDEWEELEEKFEWTRILYNLQQTCPIHEVGMKNLELQRYTCPTCNKVLEKSPKLVGFAQ